MRGSLLLLLLLPLAFTFTSSFAHGHASPKHEEEDLSQVINRIITFFQALEDKEARIPELIKTLQDIKITHETINEEEVLRTIPDDTFRTIPEIIRDKGYPAEEHTVRSPDGFLLKVFRIPYGRSNNSTYRPPVLVSHGLIDTAGGWVVNYANQSLPYLLADAGYDVFLGNIRGNKYGEEHEKYDRYDPRLWEFSFDEQGKYDIPATLDYIRGATGFEKVAIVGHSQGCTQFFASMYFTPEVANKVSFFGALAPALYFDENTNWLINLAADLHIAELMQLFGVNKFLPIADSIIRSLTYVCHSAPKTVEYLIGLLCGQNPGEFNYNRMAVNCYQSLGMTSVQNMVHWAQMVRTEEFKAYDYGWFKNEKVYGQRTPPEFEVEKIYPKNVPIAVFYGSRDELATASDVEAIISHLPVDPVFVKNIPQYAHLDLTWGINAATLIYDDLISLMKKHVPTTPSTSS